MRGGAYWGRGAVGVHAGHAARQAAAQRPPAHTLAAHPPARLPARPQVFQLSNAAPLPPQLLPYLRVVHATRESDVAGASFAEGAGPVSAENETMVLNQVR